LPLDGTKIASYALHHTYCVRPAFSGFDRPHAPYSTTLTKAGSIARPAGFAEAINKRNGKSKMFDPREKIALFIDGANLYATAKSLGFDIDYKRLLVEFQGKGYLLRAYYYTALAEDQEYSSIRPLIDWLDYNGYTVVTKPTKEFVDASGRRKIKGNMDIELAVHVMEMVEWIDHLVLFSGDGDFRSLVEAVQRKGRKVSVVSTLTTQPPMIADELRRQADHFIDLATMQSKVGRDPAERAHRQAERTQTTTFQDEFEEDEAF
jgi:uncharacterized LabA/DUF88 family protein